MKVLCRKALASLAEDLRQETLRADAFYRGRELEKAATARLRQELRDLREGIAVGCICTPETWNPDCPIHTEGVDEDGTGI